MFGIGVSVLVLFHISAETPALFMDKDTNYNSKAGRDQGKNSFFSPTTTLLLHDGFQKLVEGREGI